MKPTPRMLIADHVLTRMGVAAALEGLVTVCGEAEDVDSAVRVALELRPDLCLIGENLPGAGVRAVRRIARQLPTIRIIFLAAGEDSSELVPALRAGAVGYVPGGFEPAQLRRAVEAALSDEAAVPRSLVKELVEELQTLEQAVDDRLSGREAQILAMLRCGASTATIASRLQISPVTVRRHISKLIHKIGVGDRSELAARFAAPDSEGTNA